MLAQVVVVEDFVDKSGVSGPVVFLFRLAQGKIEGEVWKLFLDGAELIFVEYFAKRASPIPETHFTGGSLGVEEVEDV